MQLLALATAESGGGYDGTLTVQESRQILTTLARGSGSGTEGKLLIPGWTYKIEYLYVDLGSLDDPDVEKVAGATGGQIHTHTHFTDNIIRLGVNYQFH